MLKFYFYMKLCSLLIKLLGIGKWKLLGFEYSNVCLLMVLNLVCICLKISRIRIFFLFFCVNIVIMF